MMQTHASLESILPHYGLVSLALLRKYKQDTETWAKWQAFTDSISMNIFVANESSLKYVP